MKTIEVGCIYRHTLLQDAGPADTKQEVNRFIVVGISETHVKTVREGADEAPTAWERETFDASFELITDK